MLNWTYLEISEWCIFITYKQKGPSLLSFKMLNIKFRVWVFLGFFTCFGIFGGLGFFCFVWVFCLVGFGLFGLLFLFWGFVVVVLMWIVIACISQNCKGFGIWSLLKCCKILLVCSWVSSWEKRFLELLYWFNFYALSHKIQAALPLQKVLLLSQDLC